MWALLEPCKFYLFKYFRFDIHFKRNINHDFGVTFTRSYRGKKELYVFPQELKNLICKFQPNRICVLTYQYDQYGDILHAVYDDYDDIN